MLPDILIVHSPSIIIISKAKYVNNKLNISDMVHISPHKFLKLFNVVYDFRCYFLMF